MNQRTEKILEAAIQGFIDTGLPISSGWLYERHDFGIKPAMIRSELEELSRHGFLEQPHHSAGRIPKDKGYEFFVEKILERGTPPKDLSLAADLFEEEVWPDFLEKMSSSLGILSAAMAAHRIYKTGLEELVENWDEPQLIKEVVRDFANLESRMEEISGSVERENTPRVFIGRSPFTESGELSVIAGSYGDNSRRVVLVAIGPKRMDYKKAIKIFRSGPRRQAR